MKYPLTFYVKSLPPTFAGMANGPVIRILEKYKDDAGLHAHELTHVRQWVLSLGLHSLLYLLSDRYKLWAEVQAVHAWCRRCFRAWPNFLTG